MTLFYALAVAAVPVMVYLSRDPRVVSAVADAVSLATPVKVAVSAPHVLSIELGDPGLGSPEFGSAAAGAVPPDRFRTLNAVLLELHVVRRLHECLCVHAFTARGMPAINLVAGVGYYLLAAATAAFSAPGAQWHFDDIGNNNSSGSTNNSSGSNNANASHAANPGSDSNPSPSLLRASLGAVPTLLAVACWAWAEWRQAVVHRHMAALRSNSNSNSSNNSSNSSNSSSSSSSSSSHTSTRGAADGRHVSNRLHGRDAAGGGHYGVPDRRVVGPVLCTHYLCEMMAYAAIALVARPGAWAPWGNLVFVVVNLGGTAAETRAWYRDRLGVTRPALIPGVF
jgi:hypothetical protein